MVEYRTRPPGGKKGQGSGDWLERAFKQAFANIQDDPEAQARLALAVRDNYGLDLAMVAPALPKLGEGLQMIEAQEQPQDGPPAGAKIPNDSGPEQGTMELKPMSETPDETPTVEQTPELRKPTPEELIGFLDQIIDYVGPDLTLGELKEWAEDNPDLLNTAIELEF